MKVIITGAGGFLGKSLIDRLMEHREVEIFALTTQIEKMEKEYRSNPNIKVLPAKDLLNKNIKFDEKDILINCAFPRSAEGEGFAKGLKYISNTIQAAACQGIGGIINISSQSVYSQKRELPAVETTPVILESNYATGKYAVELLMEAICSNTSYTNIRLASLIGPGFEQRVTNKMVIKALKESKLNVQTKEEKFGFLDIEDAVSGVLGLLKVEPKNWKPIYNLGGTQVYTLLDIAKVISKVFLDKLNKNIDIEIEEGSLKLNTALDSELISKDTGYEQKISLEESILRILEKNLEK